MSDSDTKNTDVDDECSDSQVTEKTQKVGRGKDIDWLEITRYPDKASYVRWPISSSIIFIVRRSLSSSVPVGNWSFNWTEIAL